MATMKTIKNQDSVSAFIENVEDERKREDCRMLIKIMSQITGSQAAMWGSSIVGFGSYHYRYASGREGDFFLTGFSPRKQNLTVYVMPGFSQYDSLMQKLGKHKVGKSCLYMKKLEDVDIWILTRLIDESVQEMRRKYPNCQTI